MSKERENEVMMLRADSKLSGWEICLADKETERVHEILDTVRFDEILDDNWGEWVWEEMKDYKQLIHRRVTTAQRVLRVRRFAENLKESSAENTR